MDTIRVGDAKDDCLANPGVLWQHVRANWRNWAALTGLTVVFVVLEFAATPFKRHISPEGWDQSKYPYKQSIVPGWWAPIYGLVLPLVLAVAYHILSRCEIREFHDLLFSVLLNLITTATITEALKLAIGRPRPNYYEHCYGHPFENSTEFDVYDPPDCTNDDESGMEDARKSFPSGHTSWAMSAFFYITLFAIGKLRLFERETEGKGWKFLVSVLPSCVGIGIGITRIDDYHHHWTDVLAGALLGMGVSLAVYLFYYPWPCARSGAGVPLYQTAQRDFTSPPEGDPVIDLVVEEGMTPMAPINAT